MPGWGGGVFQSLTSLFFNKRISLPASSSYKHFTPVRPLTIHLPVLGGGVLKRAAKHFPPTSRFSLF